MTFHRRLTVHGLAVVAAAATLAGCGASADPADVKEATTHLTSSNAGGVQLTADQAECRAKAYLESDLSAKAIEKFRTTGLPSAATKHDVEVLREIANTIARDCS